MNANYKTVLVTGGAGFLGRHLLFHLLDEGFNVRCFDRVKPSWLNSDIEFVEGDFTATHILEQAFKNIDVVVHLVSTTLPHTSNNDPTFDVVSNLVGTLGLLDLAVKYRVKRVIFISSGGTIYGKPFVMPVTETHSTNPLCSYGIIKLTIEKYLRLYHHLYGLSSCALRLSNLYGEYQRIDTGQGAIAVFCHKALRGEIIDIWGDGNIVRDFIYVKDSVVAITKAIYSNYSGAEINIGSSQGTSLNQIIKRIETVLGRNISCRYLPGRPFDIQEVCLDISAAKLWLDWEPSTDLDKGIELMIAWMKQDQSAL